MISDYKIRLVGIGLLQWSLAAYAAPTTQAYTITDVVNNHCVVSNITPDLSSPEIIFPDDSGTQAMCVAAYTSVQIMLQQMTALIGVSASSDITPTGSFTFYVTTPDPADPDPSQTTAECGTLSNQGPPIFYEGGSALCNLLHYVTDVGTTPAGSLPTPDSRDFSAYFSSLLTDKALITNFQAGTTYDPMIQALGEGIAPNTSTSGGITAFYNLVDIPNKNDLIYYPDSRWATAAPAYADPDGHYHGISGGGGSGWGGELNITTANNSVETLLSFGGGGGGGMTQDIINASNSLYAGSGGGGGIQFSSGIPAYNKLGLGAGTGTQFTSPSLLPTQLPIPAVQYSYSQVGGCTTHDYSPSTLQAYNSALAQLKTILQQQYQNHLAITFVGGGGMGGGMEYIDKTGEEYAPHPLSTQGGFSFQYTFQNPAPSTAPPAPSSLETLYSQIGQIYQDAANTALLHCKGYDNYACTCYITQGVVIGEAAALPGMSAATVPSWLSNQYCPGQLQANCPTTNVNGLTNYQQTMLYWLNTALPKSSSTAAQPLTQNVTAYFNAINTPPETAVDNTKKS